MSPQHPKKNGLSSSLSAQATGGCFHAEMWLAALASITCSAARQSVRSDAPRPAASVLGFVPTNLRDIDVTSIYFDWSGDRLGIGGFFTSQSDPGPFGERSEERSAV